jgi:hypothetical protein
MERHKVQGKLIAYSYLAAEKNVLYEALCDLILLSFKLSVPLFLSACDVAPFNLLKYERCVAFSEL